MLQILNKGELNIYNSGNLGLEGRGGINYSLIIKTKPIRGCVFLFDIIVLFAFHAERLDEEEKTIKREGIKKYKKIKEINEKRNWKKA